MTKAPPQKSVSSSPSNSEAEEEREISPEDENECEAWEEELDENVDSAAGSLTANTDWAALRDVAKNALKKRVQRL